jgi:hypothetical protein
MRFSQLTAGFIPFGVLIKLKQLHAITLSNHHLLIERQMDVGLQEDEFDHHRTGLFSVLRAIDR